MSQFLDFLSSDLGSIAWVALFFLISSISRLNRKKNRGTLERNNKSKNNDSFIDVRKEILKKQLERKKEQSIKEVQDYKPVHKPKLFSAEKGTDRPDQFVSNYGLTTRKALHVDSKNSRINANVKAKLIRQKIRNGFKSREASKVALICGEILTKPVGLRD